MTTPYDGTEDVMSKYAPEGCTTEDDVIDGIDEIEKRDRNKYCTDVQMARIDNDGQSKMAWLKRVATFQIILNFIEEAMQTVPPSVKIDKYKANYTLMKKQSQKAYDALNGETRLHAGSTPQPQQRDNSFKQKRPFNGNTSSQAYTPRDNSFNKPPQPNTSARGAVCSKCQHKGHFARDCTAANNNTSQ
jgi:hypothetical protein